MNKVATRPALPFAARGLLLFAACALASCIDPQPPVLFVPLDSGAAQVDPFLIVGSSLEQLGFRVQRVDRARRIVATDWKPGDSLSGETRTRVEVKVQFATGQGGATVPGFIVAVPIQLRTGDRWMMHGEDEEARQKVVATLLSRMQAAAHAR